MDFIELYWIPLLLILAGLCISVFKLIRMTKSSDLSLPFLTFP